MGTQEGRRGGVGLSAHGGGGLRGAGQPFGTWLPPGTALALGIRGQDRPFTEPCMAGWPWLLCPWCVLLWGGVFLRGGAQSWVVVPGHREGQEPGHPWTPVGSDLGLASALATPHLNPTVFPLEDSGGLGDQRGGRRGLEREPPPLGQAGDCFQEQEVRGPQGGRRKRPKPPHTHLWPVSQVAMA